MTDIKIRGKFTVEGIPVLENKTSPLNFLQLKLLSMQPYQVEAFSCSGEKDKKPRCPDVFIERAVQCTREGLQALCGTDEEYSEYIKKFMKEKEREKN